MSGGNCLDRNHQETYENWKKLLPYCSRTYAKMLIFVWLLLLPLSSSLPFFCFPSICSLSMFQMLFALKRKQVHDAYTKRANKCARCMRFSMDGKCKRENPFLWTFCILCINLTYNSFMCARSAVNYAIHTCSFSLVRSRALIRSFSNQHSSLGCSITHSQGIGG